MFGLPIINCRLVENFQQFWVVAEQSVVEGVQATEPTDTTTACCLPAQQTDIMGYCRAKSIVYMEI